MFLRILSRDQGFDNSQRRMMKFRKLYINSDMDKDDFDTFLERSFRDPDNLMYFIFDTMLLGDRSDEFINSCSKFLAEEIPNKNYNLLIFIQKGFPIID